MSKIEDLKAEFDQLYDQRVELNVLLDGLSGNERECLQRDIASIEDRMYDIENAISDIESQSN